MIGYTPPEYLGLWGATLLGCSVLLGTLAAELLSYICWMVHIPDCCLSQCSLCQLQPTKFAHLCNCNLGNPCDCNRCNLCTRNVRTYDVCDNRVRNRNLGLMEWPRLLWSTSAHSQYRHDIKECRYKGSLHRMGPWRYTWPPMQTHSLHTTKQPSSCPSSTSLQTSNGAAQQSSNVAA